jgi:hypothetical protein
MLIADPLGHARSGANVRNTSKRASQWLISLKYRKAIASSGPSRPGFDFCAIYAPCPPTLLMRKVMDHCVASFQGFSGAGSSSQRTALGIAGPVPALVPNSYPAQMLASAPCVSRTHADNRLKTAPPTRQICGVGKLVPRSHGWQGLHGIAGSGNPDQSEQRRCANSAIRRCSGGSATTRFGHSAMV